MQKHLMKAALMLAAAVVLAGAGCTQHYITTFKPKQEPTRQLDMNYKGGRAKIAVMDFRVKAAGATIYIGDGLREMLQTALFESERFDVMDRQDMKGLVAEQALSQSQMAARGQKNLAGRMGVAELMMYGTVTEFLKNASGVAASAEAGNLPGKAEVSMENAHMAIDIRVVDAATGRLVAARRIEGSATSGQALVGAKVGGGITEMPVSLGMYKDTPMELAIRDCIYRAVIYVSNQTPRRYFRY
jgi:curli biogenesis system outer membrane secretion channel CsgG